MAAVKLVVSDKLLIAAHQRSRILKASDAWYAGWV
jgi:hypothetical protein